MHDADYLTVDGRLAYVEVFGADGPPVLCVHTAGQSGVQFRYVSKEEAPEPVATTELLTPNPDGRFIQAGGGTTLKNVPAHHGVDLRKPLTRDERLAINPARAAREAAQNESSAWTPPVLRTVASKGEGVMELVEAVDKHFNYLERSGALRERRRTRLRARVVEVVESKVRGRLWSDDATNRWLDEHLGELESGGTNPFAVADELLKRSASLLTNTRSEAR